LCRRQHAKALPGCHREEGWAVSGPQRGITCTKAKFFLIFLIISKTCRFICKRTRSTKFSTKVSTVTQVVKLDHDCATPANSQYVNNISGRLVGKSQIRWTPWCEHAK
jgi:hypothetical protein